MENFVLWLVGIALVVLLCLGMYKGTGSEAIVEEYRESKEQCEAGLPRNQECSMVFLSPTGT